jgi:hypothetical protein
MSANTDFVLSVIGGLSGTVGLDGTQLQYIVDDAVEAYGVSDEADATDDLKLHALLRYYTWLKVRDELLLDPSSYSADGESFGFKPERLDAKVNEALAKALPYLPNGQVGIGRMTFPDDPYSIDGQVKHDA